jgi:DNA (cytosine-5)-methyltransferase 1
MKTLTAVDLFAGIGGIRLGFEKAGFKIIFSNDFDSYATEVYRKNFGDIDSRPLQDIGTAELPKKFDVLLAGFPCQPFSTAGKKKGFSDARGTMFFELVKILKATEPRAFFFENVRHLLTHDGGRTFSTMLQILKCELGYEVFVSILNSKDFGVPQNRERLYIVGFKNPSAKFDFSALKKKKTKPIKSILETEVLPEYHLSERYYEGLLNHRARHAKAGNGFGCQILDPEGIANTLVAGNMGRERNLIQDKRLRKHLLESESYTRRNETGVRKLTVNECKALQGFPKSFKIPVSIAQSYRLLGNSVSVPVIREIAQQMLTVLSRPSSRNKR